MDEILIGEKKYVSSKQAAKVTGYAKDYIGQLCREGRVPARLVGRSWYVLETAIHDHRFGDQKTEEETQKLSSEPILPTWEAPRYEASPTENILSLNRLQNTDKPVPTEINSPTSEHLQNSWGAWFDRVAETKTVEAVTPAVSEEEPAMEEEKVQEEVSVPIHTIYQPQYQPLPEELLPRQRHTEVYPKSGAPEEKGQKEGKRLVVKAIQMSGALFAGIMVIFAILGSGYFDSSIISNSQVRMFAGINLYNR